MEWLRYFLVDFLQVWKWQGLNNWLIALAVVVQAGVAIALYRLQHEIENERKRVNLLVDCRRDKGGGLVLEYTNMTPTAVRIEKIRFSIVVSPDQKKGSYESQPGWIVQPYNAHAVAATIPYFEEAIHDLGLLTLIGQGEARIEVETTYFAYGKRVEAECSTFLGHFEAGRFVFD